MGGVGVQAGVSSWSWSSLDSLSTACGYATLDHGCTHYGWGYLVEHGLRVDLGKVLPPVLDGLGLAQDLVAVTVHLAEELSQLRLERRGQLTLPLGVGMGQVLL